MTVKKVGVSERRACKVLTQARATQRYRIKPPDDEGKLTEAIINLASQYGRYGYRRVTALLRNEGWLVNHKRVERIWRQEGLKAPPQVTQGIEQKCLVPFYLSKIVAPHTIPHSQRVFVHKFILKTLFIS